MASAFPLSCLNGQGTVISVWYHLDNVALQKATPDKLFKTSQEISKCADPCSGRQFLYTGHVVNKDCSLSKDSVKELYDLYSSQEEADTRLMLHIHDACTRFGINTAIIWSPDTDVFILGIHFSGQFDINIWFKTGTKQSTRLTFPCTA